MPRALTDPGHASRSDRPRPCLAGAAPLGHVAGRNRGRSARSRRGYRRYGMAKMGLVVVPRGGLKRNRFSRQHLPNLFFCQIWNGLNCGLLPQLPVCVCEYQFLQACTARFYLTARSQVSLLTCFCSRFALAGAKGSTARPASFSRPVVAANATRPAVWTAFVSEWVEAIDTPGGGVWIVELSCLQTDVQYLLFPYHIPARCEPARHAWGPRHTP